MSIEKSVAVTLASVLMLNLAACKPADPPPDIIKTQREALQKAKAVQGVQDKAVQEQAKSVQQQVNPDEPAKQGDDSGK